MRRVLLILALLLHARSASAAGSCTITLASINLGTYDVFGGTDVVWSGSLSYSCSGAAQGPIYVDFSQGAGAFAQRLATNGSAPNLRYNIYTDAATQTIWGDGTGVTGEYLSSANPQNGRVYVVAVYGRIPARQDVAVGTYSDSLLATISWTKKNVTNSATIAVPVQVTVPSSCTLATTSIAFGAYDPVGANAAAPLNAVGSLATTCTRGAMATIGLDAGQNPAGPQRQMSDGAGHFLAYTLFQDGALTAAWGNAGAALLSPPASPDFNPRLFTVYAQIPGGQDAAVGAYVDKVIATVTY